MNRRHFLTSAGLGLLAACSSASEQGFEPLFNGSNLDGWEGDESLWLVEGDAIVGRSPGISENVFLANEREYGDFVLRFDIRLLDDQGNTGCQFRSIRLRDSTEMYGYQADGGPDWWGNLYDESRRRVTLAKADPDLIAEVVNKGDWNAYEVQAVGPNIALSINGRLTAAYHETEPGIARSGLIAPQIHAGPAMEVHFRNLRIKEL
jgi:hypothetical protein